MKAWANRKSRRHIMVWTVLILFLTGSAAAEQTWNPKLFWSTKDRRAPTVTSDLPAVEYTSHNRGNILLAVANNGTFGTHGQTIPDPFTGEAIPSGMYPKGSDIVFLWVAAIWIGAIVGRDTLVSCADEDWYNTREFWPEVKPFGDFVYESIDVNSPFFSPNAHSEQDIICEYADTNTLMPAMDQDNRRHHPLGVKVYQRSMAWSYSYADDFILFDYQVENIGDQELKDVFLGIWVDGDVWHVSRNGPIGWNDDIVGFRRDYPAFEGCGFLDTVNIAWTADNDGDPVGRQWNDSSALGVVGVRVVRTPSRKLRYAYNWWIISYGPPSRDFGPRQRPKPGDPFRNMYDRLGTPVGDPNKYYVMSHNEFDYDLLYTALDHTSEGWLPPPPDAYDYAHGWDTRYILSFGPFDVNPGEKLPISFAVVGGEDLHRDPTAFEQHFDPYSPSVYYRSLDFSNVALNSRWASWVYDNPGIDTDGDGYFGKFRVCDQDTAGTYGDTTWYEGDGIPDFRGAGPPPAPRIRIIPSSGRFIVRWNGYYTENTPDIFSQMIDFEGYRVYVGLDDRPSSFSPVASWDREDYNRYKLKVQSGQRVWVLEETPFTLDSLRLIYNDPSFDPLMHTRSHPLFYRDTLYYFEAQDFNASYFSEACIHKVYPSAPRPPSEPAMWRPEEIVDGYSEPLPKYYEYELVIDDLLPTIPYYVAVTSFDFGSPLSGLPALESDPTNNFIAEYAQIPADVVAEQNKDVYVYPNPYRIDASYRELRFEGRLDRDRPDDRVRALHFANLPAKCVIRIYSLDGDLIRELVHDKEASDPKSSHAVWNLITRNAQTVTSGLYYWVVESPDRTQIGKLVILR